VFARSIDIPVLYVYSSNFTTKNNVISVGFSLTGKMNFEYSSGGMSVPRTELVVAEELRAAINLVKVLRDELYRCKLQNLVHGMENCHIDRIKFSGDSFEIKYTHTTTRYTLANYLSKNNGGDSSEDEDETFPPPYQQRTEVSFGNNPYSISGGRFQLYRSNKNIRMKSRRYVDNFDLARHAEYFSELSSNVDVPEYLAIKFFISVSLAQWSDSDIHAYFNMV